MNWLVEKTGGHCLNLCNHNVILLSAHVINLFAFVQRPTPANGYNPSALLRADFTVSPSRFADGMTTVSKITLARKTMKLNNQEMDKQNAGLKDKSLMAIGKIDFELYSLANLLEKGNQKECANICKNLRYKLDDLLDRIKTLE